MTEANTHSRNLPDAADEFVTSRTLDAPRARVWRAWTEADRLAAWFGPAGTTIEVRRFEPRPGGVFHYLLRLPGGMEMWGRWVFREIAEPDRLVFLASFSDAEGGVSRAPFSADWPLEVLSTVTLEDADGGRTRLVLRGIPYGAMDGERAAFRAGHDSMQGGWGGTFAQLEGYLAGDA